MLSIKELMQVYNLSYKQSRFVQEFKGNATDAARQAGYKQPSVEGCRLLKLDKIMNAINAVNESPRVSSVMSKQELIEGYTSIARDTGVNEQARLKAMDSISRIYGLFIDKQLIAAKVEQYDRLTDQELMNKLDSLVAFLNTKGIHLPLLPEPESEPDSNKELDNSGPN